MIDRYALPSMRDLWSDERRYRTWLEVELAACRAMERAGMVPTGTADRVTAAVKLDAAKINEIEKTTRHDVIAFLTQVEETAGEPARWLHLGMTSSDVLDTAFALQLRQAIELLLSEIDRLESACLVRAGEFRHVPIIGRTHGIHAELTSLGLVFGRFAAALARDRRRIQTASQSVSVGKLSGAVGTYAHLPPEIEREALASLGLEPETIPSQVVQRDRHAELFSALAISAGNVEQMALTIRHWQRTEVAEAREPFGKGQKGSSAMPHKRNPILSENLTGLARLVRSYAAAALEDIALWHERDISHSSVERVIAPDATTLLHFMLHRASQIIEGLVVDRAAIEKNIGLTRGLCFSEGVLLRLVQAGLARQEAYALVQRNALRAWDEEADFKDLLKQDPDIASKLKPEEIEQCFDPRYALRHVDTILDRVMSV